MLYWAAQYLLDNYVPQILLCCNYPSICYIILLDEYVPQKCYSEANIVGWLIMSWLFMLLLYWFVKYVLN